MASGLFTLKQQNQAFLQGAWNGQKTPTVDYLVVAGGGGGTYTGGGGAGGVLVGNIPVALNTSITVTVGGGGAGYTGSTAARGADSVFGSITASGGGAGAGNYNVPDSTNAGGSGGGGGIGNAASGQYGGQGIPGQGNIGGYGTGSSSGGGGGAGNRGQNANNSISGYGGVGIACDITGTRTMYGGGGGGAFANTVHTNPGKGGAGGGGDGGNPLNGGNGTANTGGGGGGASYTAPSVGTGGNGGSGVVILSYPDIYPAATSTTGSPTISTSGSGSISFNGSNQYLTGPSTSALNYSTGSFTVEFWVYATTIGALSIFFSCSNSTADFQIGLSPTNYLYWHNSGNQITNVGNSSSCPLNQWNHIVLVRSGSSCALYCNGTRFGTVTNSAAVNLTQFYIGTYWNGAPNYSTTGNITNLKISNTNMYDPSSSTITVPTTPFAPLSSTNFLLNAVSGSQYADSSSSSLILGAPNSPPWASSSPFTVAGYKNRVYKWTSSGSITF